MRAEKKKYELYVLEQSLTRITVPSDAVAWRAEVMATSRLDALEICHRRGDFRPLIAAARAAGYRKLSIFVGVKDPTGRANRLDPLSVAIGGRGHE